ncbi:peptide ABC transporter permease [Halalkalibacillus sediminis]|uniref:Peptide ABC transporter permease n=1 Tax=Halalkalibacillus sediminis TaxID=2018042 RepID=A0A2I0QTA6_9BACI|nr:ABC transporter permease subunit [Halalkalibacillus sediminis]PKR77340.1 peptide ABC transporter permease [Halalkalibacillus sediminis]
MLWTLCRNLLVFVLVLIGFILILLLPREMEVSLSGPLQFEADHPFTLEIYLDNIAGIISHFQTEMGFGTTLAGTPIVNEVHRYLVRSLKIIIPTFFLVMLLGPMIGVVQFYYREHKRGKVMSFFTWVIGSIPDFFLFIAIQYLLIKMIRAGLPHFSLFGNDEWYSFIIPLISLMIFPLLHMVKVTSVAMENESIQEHVRTDFSKGLTLFMVLRHMLKNCGLSIVHQSQFVMLYILSSLPIIELLSNYNGAGYQLLESVLNNEPIRALALVIPFLLLMFCVMSGLQAARFLLLPREVKRQ